MASLRSWYGHFATRIQHHAYTDSSQQSHIHLISGHQFPLVAHLNLETAFKYLCDAPIIVKQTAPMSWTYVNAPSDGTIWLEWLSPTKNNRLPSDGYIYGDPESTYRQDYGGYTIEVMVHNLGYKPGEHLAAHSRTRYHFISKAPNVNAAAPDPSLWIVHYTQARQQFIMPSQQIPVDNHTRMIMHERNALQSQGRLERKDFMLHDREHWPQIHGPSGGQMGHNMMAQGFYGANPQPMAQSGGRYNRTNSITGPPSKRPRMNDPAASHDAAHDTSIEDDENTALGDYFDHLTPRDISMARYMQHHRWMEEVFSSPYATGQIVPADLGLGLVGELKHLTDGILEPPSTDLERTGERPLPPKAKEAQPFTNLKKEQLEDFNKRIQKHLDDGQAEIERMKAEHAAKMQEWKKSKTLLQAEKRLRNATWEGHEAAVYRLEEPATNGHADKHETVEDVVKDVESLLGVKLAGHQDATLVEKGGLEEPQQPPPQPEPQDNRQSVPPPQQAQGFQPAASPYAQPNPQQQLQPQNMPQPSVSPAPSQQHQQAQAPPPQQPPVPQPAPQQQPTQPNPDIQMPDSMDLDPSNLDFSTANSAAPTPSNQPQQQPQQQPSTNNTPGNDAALDFQQEGSMFADSFGDLGDGDGDGLIDFGGGLGDSAFGDAMHGMDEGEGMFGDGNGGS